MSTETMNLKRLAEPFHPDDVEWRVARVSLGQRGKVNCRVLAYITARAIQHRLDDVCGPENWRNEEPRIITVNGKSAFACGVSIRIEGEWVTKWDVADPTNIEAAKGGFSGAMKRAGAQWGIGRYLYHLEETKAETSDVNVDGWKYAKLPGDKGTYWWKAPNLPAWAMPKEKELEVTEAELDGLKKAWRAKFAPDTKNPKELREGFSRFVASVVGESFPSSDFTLWTRDALERCHDRIIKTSEPGGVSPNVPFEE